VGEACHTQRWKINQGRAASLSKIEHSRGSRLGLAGSVLPLRATPESETYSAMIICAQIVIIATDNASKVITTAPTPMTCLAGPLISSADPTAWSSRMVLSSETQQAAELENVAMVFAGSAKGLETPGSR